MSILKEIIRRTFLYKPYRDYSAKVVLNRWVKQGRPIPPPHYYKQSVIKKLAEDNQIKIFIETGTYKGDMIEAMIPYFEQLFSIEIFKPLFDKAVKLFKSQPKITILNGDSGALIKDLLSKIQTPCLFWLDGHFSGDGTGKTDKHTPIIAELDAIFKHTLKNHIILIDDARLFNGKDDYPTIQELTDFMLQNSSYRHLSVDNDLILIQHN